MFENCPECGNYVEVIKDAGKVSYLPASPLPETLTKYNVPFLCTTCGNLNFPLKAIRSVVFLFPVDELGNPEKIGNVVIPEVIRSNKDSEYGVVLTVGKYQYNSKGLKFPVEIVDGDLVVYDRNTYSMHYMKGTDGKVKRLRWCYYIDILALVRGY